ncbi:beta-ketoacyl-[acyl-carrier-protein] synthase family protein [Salegentibacter salarius]|uniref:3-oxoacyl-[acyl-carrier-protein] synthase 1 n=1 Tax=Salegentibacter salarius TaxID=435906 RepID=A0A2N0TMQ9_9FLAO|nr:beta-ketoacyl-[acyl-carrier-protein] synthase family protein [Salegentibacter salarius]OEY71387.1 beta-ketoacyl-ACP synthase [Salegentibacter salarius]PKD16024.1 beta-ketoacyl-ACP synthase [Salegentibacter salarius]SLJ91904.1 3-oxoacyl-(acyl-carrier-protein) synthase [Salegentibacter salarius]
MKKRVVVTGMGVVAPNAVGLANFEDAIRKGESGIRFEEELERLKFSCQIAGKPQISEEKIAKYFTPLQLRGLNSSGIVYGVIAGTDAWNDAGLKIEENEQPDWDSGVIFGTGILGVDKFREAIHLIDAGKTRRLGSTSVMQTMASGISAYLGGILGCGNQVTTNSSACTTGTEALLMGFERIVSGKAKRMLVGSCSDHGPYVWGGFDAMRILPSKYNKNPSEASRPMSASAAGFVPGSGAGALVLEDYESAKARGAKIYCEVLGGATNSGGQRGGGSMTAANSEAVIRCIKDAIQFSGISAEEIDLINGHLTATTRDALEIENWKKALKNDDFPYINSLKGMTGHCLAASGSIECVASVLQIDKNFIFGNTNCEDLNPEISALISEEKVPRKTLEKPINILAKASFGFGDVNAVAIFKKIQD